MDDMQPGQIIAPNGPDEKPAGDGSPKPERPTEQPEPVPDPGTTPEPDNQTAAEAAAPSPAPTVAAEPAQPTQDPAVAGWQFHQEQAGTPAAQPLAPPQEVSWTASEFIAHEKSAGWYTLLAAGGVVVAVLVYLLTKDKISTGVVVLAAIAFGFFAARKPRTLHYNLTGRGLQIGEKLYGFQSFKTFSVAEEGAIASVNFLPMRRFMPPLTIYLAPDIEERVLDFLSAYLPFEEHKADAVDSLIKRMRF